MVDRLPTPVISAVAIAVSLRPPVGSLSVHRGKQGELMGFG